MGETKLDPRDLDFPCRELSNGGLGIVVAILACWQINVSLTHIERPIQLYCSLIAYSRYIFVGSYSGVHHHSSVFIGILMRFRD